MRVLIPAWLFFTKGVQQSPDDLFIYFTLHNLMVNI